MRMEDFCVGDRVRATGKARWAGETGTIACVVASNVGVEFDTFNSRRHTCSGAAKKGHGWWYWVEGDLELLEEEPFPDVDDLI